MQALDHGYADPRCGGYRQIQESRRSADTSARVRSARHPVRRLLAAAQGPRRGRQSHPRRARRPKLKWVQRERSLVKVQHVFNVEQTEGLKLRSLQATGPEWEAHERAETLIRGSGVRVDHVAGDRPYYSPKDDRVVLPERSQSAAQSVYTHTALHELGHATGHPERLNRPTQVNHGGFGSEAYAREKLRGPTDPCEGLPCRDGSACSGRDSSHARNRTITGDTNAKAPAVRSRLHGSEAAT